MTALAAPGGSSDPVVEARAISVGYDGVTVVHDVDLDVRRGDVVAVLGANGSGKSTLVRAMVGLLPVTTGTLRLFGTAGATGAARARLGYVPQRASLLAGVPASVGEVVASGLLTGHRALWPFRRVDRSRIHAALATVGLGEHASRPVASLSGGQQQRMLIARALVRAPELLVLDEPTAGVDMASQQAFADTLGLLAHDGTTVIVVLHEIGPIASLISREVVLHTGRVAYDGPPRRPTTAPAGGIHDLAADPHEPRWLP